MAYETGIVYYRTKNTVSVGENTQHRYRKQYSHLPPYPKNTPTNQKMVLCWFKQGLS